MDAVLLNGFPVWVLVIVIFWALPWKGFALWKAAQLSHKKWFIVLFIANTFGVLDIIYIYFIARKYSVEISETK